MDFTLCVAEDGLDSASTPFDIYRYSTAGRVAVENIH